MTEALRAHAAVAAAEALAGGAAHGASALAPYAAHAATSRGRRVAEPPAPTRDAFQRDRDRIVHSTAFRRLVYKTQVFLSHERDHHRTRLTHSLEVAQLGRSIARSLRLNEDLVEALALAHDLGHTPFGHAGQHALNAAMRSDGGFEHNLQSLRVVDKLEQRYPAWDGLNLSFETREGIVKRCAPELARTLDAAEPGGVWQRFITGGSTSLEAQLTNLADEIAYNAHDVDDGVRSGLLTLPMLAEVPLIARFIAEVEADHPDLGAHSPRRLLAEVIRRMLSAQVYDVIATSRAAIEAAAPHSAEAVRALPPLIAFSPAMREASTALKRFLFRALYRHPQVMQTNSAAQVIVSELFDAYRASGEVGSAPRAVADYIAGMTDRFAIREHQRLTGRQLLPL